MIDYASRTLSLLERERERQREREREREICLFASNLFNKLPLKTHTKKTMILRFKIKQTDNNAYISNQRALLRYDAVVGRDKSHLITSVATWPMTNILAKPYCPIAIYWRRHSRTSRGVGSNCPSSLKNFSKIKIFRAAKSALNFCAILIYNKKMAPDSDPEIY